MAQKIKFFASSSLHTLESELNAWQADNKDFVINVLQYNVKSLPTEYSALIIAYSDEGEISCREQNRQIEYRAHHFLNQLQYKADTLAPGYDKSEEDDFINARTQFIRSVKAVREILGDPNFFSNRYDVQ